MGKNSVIGPYSGPVDLNTGPRSGHHYNVGPVLPEFGTGRPESIISEQYTQWRTIWEEAFIKYVIKLL